MSDSNPFEATSASAKHPPPAPRDLAITVVLTIAAALGGGYVCGLVLDKYGEFGSVSLWLLGWIVGAVAAKLIKPHRVAGYLLAGGVVAAFVVAEVCWIRLNIENAEQWWEAAKRFPLFLQQFQLSALIAGLMTFFGAGSAYRQAGQRVRYVAVVDA